MSCVSSTQFVVLINGDTSDFLSASRGLRQGFLLSPYFFLLLSDGLSRLIKDVLLHNNFQGILLGKTKSLSHLLFVDDILLFCVGFKANLKKPLEILDLFYDGIGLDINSTRSTHYCHNLGRPVCCTHNNSPFSLTI